jgi:dTDP-glucose 4,6-dehydratase
MRLLVTGGAGFIGSNFVRHILKARPGCEVVILDALTYCGRRESLEDCLGDITFYKGDICEPAAVHKAMEGCDAAVNFAAETHVDRSISEPSAFIRSNVLGAQVLLEEARSANLARFVQISTDEVYGSILQGSFRESDCLSPSSPYSASKAGADLLARSYFITFGLPVVITRSSNNFGPFQYPEKLIPFFVLRALKDESLPVYGSGGNVRDWLYVEDNCRAIDLVLDQGRPGEIYNIGGGCELSNLEITSRILSLLNKPESLIRHVADRPGHDRRYSVDCSKIRKLGWRPEHQFDEALQETIQWYLDNKSWWQGLL